MDDQRIIALFFQRDERAISEIQRKYAHYCGAIARRILRDEQETAESLNDTWMAAWRQIPPHRPEHLATFLGKITRRISLNRWRNAHAGKRGGGEVALALDELAECISGGESVEAEYDRHALAQLLDDFLRELPQAERRVFICRYWHLESVGEIAGRFGFTQSKVKSMLFRTRNRLRERLRREDLL